MWDRIAVMDGRQGRADRLPARALRAPRDRFVAEFIGVSNLIARRASTAARAALVGDGPRRRRAHRRERHDRTASELEVTVRPEKIKLAAGEVAASTVIERLRHRSQRSSISAR